MGYLTTDGYCYYILTMYLLGKKTSFHYDRHVQCPEQ